MSSVQIRWARPPVTMRDHLHLLGFGPPRRQCVSLDQIRSIGGGARMAGVELPALAAPAEAGEVQPFLTKTYQLVEDPTTDEVISWNEDGSSFVVWRPAEFMWDLLANRWEFGHGCFRRGEKPLLDDIHRQKSKSDGGGGSSDGSGPVPKQRPSPLRSFQSEMLLMLVLFVCLARSWAKGASSAAGSFEDACSWLSLVEKQGESLTCAAVTGVCSTFAGAMDPEPDVATEEQSDQAPPKGHLEGLTHQMPSFSMYEHIQKWCFLSLKELRPESEEVEVYL